MLMPPSRTLLFLACFSVSIGNAAATCVRFTQFVADAPQIDNSVTLLSTTAPDVVVGTLTNLRFPQVTDYLALEPGGYRVEVRAGTFPVDTRAARLHPDTDYTALAFGEFIAATDSLQALDDLLLVDDNRLAPPNRAKLRVAHLGSDTGAVDVTLDGETLFDTVSYTEATAYATVGAGNHSLLFVDVDSGGSVAELETLTLAEGSVTSVFLVGLGERLGNRRALAVVDAPNGCTAQNFQGIWFDPAQSGQGVQIAHSGERFSGVWYVYDGDGSTAWFTFLGTLQGESFSGELLRFDGPPLGEAFDPDQVSNRVAGSVTIAFSATTRSALFDASIDGMRRTLNLIPFEP